MNCFSWTHLPCALFLFNTVKHFYLLVIPYANLHYSSFLLSFQCCWCYHLWTFVILSRYRWTIKQILLNFFFIVKISQICPLWYQCPKTSKLLSMWQKGHPSTTKKKKNPKLWTLKDFVDSNKNSHGYKFGVLVSQQANFGILSVNYRVLVTQKKVLSTSVTVSKVGFFVIDE